jgi:uncharacterized SAM-binding protein YcdF (DUF218 family)
VRLAVRLAGGLLFALVIAWSAGLVSFAAAIPRELADGDSRTDAIVVPTGGYGRLLAGLEQLRAGRAERLFISGVYGGVTFSHLVGMDVADVEACCVDLGHAAQDTAENAAETAAWMAKWNFRSLRLVTGDYHMPRAILEFRRAMPDVRLVAHPVFPEHVKVESWWRYRGTAGLIASEYAKYLLALLRTPLAGPSRSSPS